MKNWISVLEKMPETNGKIITVIVNVLEVGVMVMEWNGKFTHPNSDDSFYYEATNNVTHWMPLPKGPFLEEAKTKQP